MDDIKDLPVLTDTKVTIEQGVCTVAFDRDDVRNALTGTEIVADLINIVDWINRHHEIGVLLLTGNGKAFSSGGNIKDLVTKTGMFGSPAIHLQDNYRYNIQQMTLAMYRLDVPTIAAVNGAAIGAGFDLVCMCDIRLGSTSATMGETFVNLGLISGDGGSWFLPRIVGMQRAAELTFSGRLIAAQEALALGLFMEVIEPEDLLARAKTLARSFAAKPRAALRMSKRLLQTGQRTSLGDFLDFAASQQSLCHGSEEHNAVLEKLSLLKNSKKEG
ncbi:MAG: enoyl-CoA hydratase [Gammaproteobacteria bacterium]|nr:enoyl-CoA hydratase [Gammaproteobacteria bacterium]